MAVTFPVQKVIELAREREAMDAVRGLDLLNQAHLYISTQLHLVPDVVTMISLVAGTQEYSLPDNVATIWDASYQLGPVVNGSGSYFPLKATNVDTLFEDRGPNWQLQPSGQPWGYYERGGMIGFVPAPSVSSSGGYPVVQLFYTQATTLSLTGSLPTLISSPMAWVYHICRTAADLNADPGRADMWEKRFQREMHYLREYVQNRTGRDRARVSVRVKRVRRA